ncbi:MAG: hypothetical protein IJT02_03165 [Synergistaceae bacterium]|nr:hypothetical protein [Synergistaceae bacterium]
MKRIIRLALVLGVLFSLCGSAWAANSYYLTKAEGSYIKVYNVVAAGTTKVISLRAYVRALEGTSAIEATKVKWSVSGSNITGTFDESSATTYDVDLDGTSKTLEATFTASATATTTATFKIELLSGTSSTSDKNDGDMTYAASKTVTIDFTTEAGTDERNEDFPGSWLDSTKADPDWPALWDGIDLIYGGGEDGNRGPGSADNPSVKSMTPLTFTAGTSATAKITIQGAAPSAWIGITAKDAYKLGWLADKPGKTTNADDILLTKENIKKYGIPFRVTGYDMTPSMTKGAQSTITITYNGAKVSYKGFPLTVYAINSAPKKKGTTTPYKVENVKASKKTFKLNINPNAMPAVAVTSPDEVGLAADSYTTVALDKKGVEIGLALSNDPALYGKHNYAIVLASADGPYTITVKPEEKNGIEAIVIQPSFDKYGEITDKSYAGSVTFSGDVNAAKETKTAFTVTVKNNSTGKKGSAKITVIGKIGPTIQNVVEDEDSDYKYLDPKKIKRVEAGKVPSVSVKAKGSKTIKYGLEYSYRDWWTSADANPSTQNFSVDDEDEAKALEALGWTRTYKYYEDLLADHKLSFDAAKGKVVLADKNDKATTPTLEDAYTAWYAEHGETEEEPPAFNDDEKGFSSLDIEVFADNGYGRDDAYALIGITGAKPAVYKAKGTAPTVTIGGHTYTLGDKITISRDAFVSGDVAAIVAVMVNKQLVGGPDSTDIANVKFSLAADKDSEALGNLGLELVDYYAMSTDAEIRELQAEINDENDAAKKAELQAELDSAIQRSKFYNYGVLKVADGGLGNAGSGKVNFTLENYGAVGKGGVTITLVDGGPEIAAIDSADATFNADPSEDKTKDVSLTLTAETKPTLAKTQVEWSVGSNKLGNSAKVKATIAADNTSKGKDGATLTLAAEPTNVSEHGSFDVTATNKTNNLKDVYEVGYYLLSKDQQAWTTTGVTVRYVGTFRTNGTAAPKAKAYAETAPEAEADDTAEAVDAVVFGAPRTLASLTAQQKAYLQSKGYVVVAVLDEFTAQADGQVQDFEAELDEEKATEGAKLVYIAFPQNAPEVEDDKIADFYDEDGAAIETVPASRKIVVAPWLRNGVTYQPVIAIEAE